MMKNRILNVSKILIISLFSGYPLNFAHAEYNPQEGRVTYLAGFATYANFQEKIFNNNDSHSKFGRSQSFALLVQALGDLGDKSSLMAEISFGIHKFRKQMPGYVDEYKFEAISFDLGYRRLIGGDFWWSAGIGSTYPWRITQNLTSSAVDHPKDDFYALYSAIVGLQYEAELFGAPVSYDLRVRKYMSSHIDDQMAVTLGLGWRFGPFE